MKRLLFALLLLSGSVSFAQDREKMIGCWTMTAHEGEELLQLRRDGGFAFQDWNAAKNDWDMLLGTWKIKQGKLTLYCDDRTQRSFTIKKDKAGKIILTRTGGLLLRQSVAGDCTLS